MKNPHRASEGAGTTQRGAAKCSLAGQPCPNALLCRRYSSDDGGAWCRLCWRDFTQPRPVRIAQGRS